MRLPFIEFQSQLIQTGRGSQYTYFMGLSACVSKQTVSTAQTHDQNFTCAELKTEIAKMEGLKDDFEDDSGLTGKNVGLAVLFWPGIIVNEMNATKNVDSVNDRIEHLNGLYYQKCTGESKE